jgi:hypothetical protein
MQYINYLSFINESVLRKQMFLKQICVIQSKEDAYMQLKAAELKRKKRAEKRLALMTKD